MTWSSFMAGNSVKTDGIIKVEGYFQQTLFASLQAYYKNIKDVKMFCMEKWTKILLNLC